MGAIKNLLTVFGRVGTRRRHARSGHSLTSSLWVRPVWVGSLKRDGIQPTARPFRWLSSDHCVSSTALLQAFELRLCGIRYSSVIDRYLTRMCPIADK